MKVSLIKLVSGESILCEIAKRAGAKLQIVFPMQILELATASDSGENEYLVFPWCPFAKSQIVFLNKSGIMMETEVHDDIVMEYRERIEHFLTKDDVSKDVINTSTSKRRDCDHHWDK